MCGIAGVVNFGGEAVSETVLRAMNDLLHRRGPDASGIYLADNVGLGHRRLSIIDTSTAANQPMFNEDGAVAVVFNGEIYNFQQLETELVRRGHVFQTRSDTEVIVHAWEEFGPQCVEHFRGMFAFAIYDRKQGQLFLARDRLGKKPLHYVSQPNVFAFASEMKSLLAHDAVANDLDEVALAQYATYGNSLGERTIFRCIRKLLPGHSLLLNTRSATPAPQIQRYWQFELRPDESQSNQVWLERLDSKLMESVGLRMISDVPLGAFLSGGIDSSLIVAMMAKQSGSRVKTFTIGFDESAHDESAHAAAVAEHLGTEHHVETVRPSALDVLPQLIDAYDEPFLDPSALPTYYLCQMTREHVTVALSGDGGDELFCGYGRYPWAWAIDRAGALGTPLGRTIARSFSHAMPAGMRGKWLLEKLSLQGFDLYNHVMGYSRENLALLHPDVRRRAATAAQDKMHEDYARFAQLSLREKYQYLDVMNYLPDDILVKVDRASMYHSLEVRCPLLDAEVAELSAQIPLRYKLRGLAGKRILKELAYRYVPRKLLDRPKMGFGVPLGEWFRGELSPVLDEMLADTTSPMWQYFDRQTAIERVKQHRTQRPDLGWTLWRLLYFHRWCESHLR